jgi:hypothetical protein
MSTPLVSQAAVLLSQILTQELTASCSLELLEQLAHRRAHDICRAAVEQVACQWIVRAEARPLTCSCGAAPSLPNDCNGTQQSAGDTERRPRLLQRYW